MQSSTKRRRNPLVFCGPDQKYAKLKVYIKTHKSPIRRVMKNNKYDDITLSFSGSGPPGLMKRGMANCGLIGPKQPAAEPIAMFGKG